MFDFSKVSLFHIIRENTAAMLKALTHDHPACKWQGILMLMLFIEYGLKYKLQKSGKTFPQIHNVKKLYDLLSDSDKNTIKKEYDDIRTNKHFNINITSCAK